MFCSENKPLKKLTVTAIERKTPGKVEAKKMILYMV